MKLPERKSRLQELFTLTITFGKASACSAGDPWFKSWVGKIRWRRHKLLTPVLLGFLCDSADKQSGCNAGDLGSIPGLKRSPGEGKGYPLQYSGLEKSMDCIIHGITKSRTWLSNFHFTNLLTSSNRYRKCLAKSKWQPAIFFFNLANWSFKSEIKFKIHLDEGNFLPTNKQNQGSWGSYSSGPQWGQGLPWKCTGSENSCLEFVSHMPGTILLYPSMPPPWE